MKTLTWNDQLCKHVNKYILLYGAMHFIIIISPIRQTNTTESIDIRLLGFSVTFEGQGQGNSLAWTQTDHF